METVYHPFLDKIDRMGLARLGTPQCQKVRLPRARAGLQVTLCPQELFCEMAAMGEAEHEANTVQRLLAALVRHTPASLADTLGVTEVFQVGTLSVIYISTHIYSIFDIVQFIVRQVKQEDARSSNVCNRKLNDIVIIVFQYELLGSKP